MSTTDVQIVRLEPMRVASTYGFGEHPEDQAWQILAEWAKPKGLLDDIDAHPIFGFNNPYPTPDNPKYGYEFWIKVGPAVEPEGGGENSGVSWRDVCRHALRGERASREERTRKLATSC